MKKGLKWLALGLGVLVGLIAIAVLVFYAMGSGQLNKTRDIQVESIPISEGGSALERGRFLVEAASCTICHGEDLSGDVEFDDPSIGTIYSSNITGLDQSHSEADMIRAIRHGVDTDGRQLILMPSNLYNNTLSAQDMGALIAYLKTVPPVENKLPEPQLTFVGRALLGAGVFGDVFAAEIIDHSQPFPPMPEIGANIEYGAYLAGFCTGCHGEDLAGLPADPDVDFPGAPNLTPGGELGEWSEADFIQTLRTGVSPDQHTIDPEFMPWKAYGQLPDGDLQGLWLYLQSVPPKQANN